MVDVIAAVDSATGAFGPLVQNRLLADMQNAITTGVQDTIASIDDVETAVASKVTDATVQSKLPFKWLAGDGIDPTGSTDSTAGVQAFLNAVSDGSTVTIPAGATISVSNTITITKRITLNGSGTIQWTSGVSGAPALTVAADGSIISGVRLFNASGVANQTGNKQYGIWITANFVKVTSCWVQQFQQAIAVSPYGEYHDFIIGFNHVIDVIGSGDGASNSTSQNGEDRGDGIVSWGAAGVIIGNRVSAQAGTDARIGIHVEGLGGAATTPYAHANSMVTIIGNTITGQFRRGVVSEGVATTMITGNSISDPTWWGIAVIGTSGCVVANNAIYWTRTANDNQGSAWNPRRSALMAYASGASNTFTGNNCVVAAGAQLPFGISAQTDSTGTIDYLTIQDNHVVDPANGSGNGIYLDGSVNLIRSARIRNNNLVGFLAYGIYGYACSDIDASANQLISGASSANGIHFEASNTSARVDGNSVFNTATAIAVFGRSALVTVNMNLIGTATTGIDLYGCAAAMVNSNLFNSTTTKIANPPSHFTSVGNN